MRLVTEYFSQKELEMLNLPDEEKERLMRDFDNFKKELIPNPIHDLIHNAIIEFNGLLYTAGYDYAVKNTKKYLNQFLEFVRKDEVLKADDVIAEYIIKIIESGKIDDTENVELLFYTDDDSGNAVNSMIVVKIKRPIIANVKITFSDGFETSYRKKVPAGLFVILMTTSKIGKNTIKKAFIV